MLKSGLVALVTAVLLSSCALLPFGTPDDPEASESRDSLYVDPEPKMEDRMEQIVAAVNNHDAAALKAMFSPRALDRATDIDEGLEYLLAIFPDGGLTPDWWVGPAAERLYKDGKLTELLLVEYKVSAG
jgi:hypothetical protein